MSISDSEYTMTNGFADTVKGISDHHLHVFFLGQAGFVLRNSKGELLGNDLYLSNACEKNNGHVGFKRLLPRILNAEELSFHYLVCTHQHDDHFDPESIPIMMSNPETLLFCSEGCRELIFKYGIEESRVRYQCVGDEVQAGSYHLHFICCDHGNQAPDAFGLVIEVDGVRILEVGDSSFHPEWAKAYTKYGEIDLMFAPINGEFGNLTGEECAALAQLVKPKLLVPCHFGMCASHGGDAKAFFEIMKRYPMQDWTFLSLGEELVYKDIRQNCYS